MADGTITTDDPRVPEVRALLQRHLEFCRSCTDPQDVYALDIDRLLGLERVSLETGSQPEFAAARRLYARAGFTVTGAFGDYPDSSASTFMTLELRR